MANWTIILVDWSPKPWPPVKSLVHCGVPLSVAARYQPIRRKMSPSGLARKLKDLRN